MKELVFSTSNPTKFLMGATVCKEYNIALIQNTHDIDEVQSEDVLHVAKRKAEAAFAFTKQPVIISDDAWEIEGLNGFPGTYAKSVNTWFNADDYIRLTKDLENRTVNLIQTLVYQDANTSKVFTCKTTGILLAEARGTAKPTATIMEVVCLNKTSGLSIAEELETGTHYSAERTLKVWHEFATWFKEQTA